MGCEWEGMGIPSWEWYGNGNKSQNWELEWGGMGMDCMGMGGSGNVKSHSRSSLQDSAPSHRAKVTVALLHDQVTPSFIPSALWPSNSPDLNPVDYTVRSDVLQERVYRTKISDVDELKRRINSEWAAPSHVVICWRVASRSVSTRLRSCWRRTF